MFSLVAITCWDKNVAWKQTKVQFFSKEYKMYVERSEILQTLLMWIAMGVEK